jgi:hypothetical protein
MIRVIITGPARDHALPYRIEGHAAGHGIPISGGWSYEPLFEACRVLAGLGERADALVGVFEEGSSAYPSWAMRTTVGYGSRAFIGKDGREGRLPKTVPPVETSTAAPTATPEEPPPPPSTRLIPPIYTDLGHSEPKKKAKSHHPRKPKGSGGRRGLGRGR